MVRFWLKMTLERYYFDTFSSSDSSIFSIRRVDAIPTILPHTGHFDSTIRIKLINPGIPCVFDASQEALAPRDLRVGILASTHGQQRTEEGPEHRAIQGDPGDNEDQTMPIVHFQEPRGRDGEKRYRRHPSRKRPIPWRTHVVSQSIHPRWRWPVNMPIQTRFLRRRSERSHVQRSMDQPCHHQINQSINQSINQFTIKSINQSIDRATDQSNEDVQ